MRTAQLTRCACRLIALCVAPELVLRLRKDEELTELLGLPLEAGHAQRKALDALFAGMDASGDGEAEHQQACEWRRQIWVG